MVRQEAWAVYPEIAPTSSIGRGVTDDTRKISETPEYPSRWKTLYCVDAMLEHAVMHPIRHAFQLEELMGER